MMWLLVVSVMGMSVYSGSYPSYESCAAAGRAKAVSLVISGKQSVTWHCTRMN